jgi:hypothetical protein
LSGPVLRPILALVAFLDLAPLLVLLAYVAGFAAVSAFGCLLDIQLAGATRAAFGNLS